MKVLQKMPMKNYYQIFHFFFLFVGPQKELQKIDIKKPKKPFQNNLKIYKVNNQRKNYP